jgi:DNA-binding NarL/FixJ family response regulator
MTKQDLIRLLVADDHPLTREGIVTVINSQKDLRVVAETGNGEAAVEAYIRDRPDLVLMDLRMPGMGGLEATRAILEKFPQARIIVLTSYDGDEYIHQALKIGAKAYLLKDISKEEMLLAIRTVLSGKRYIPTEVSSRLANRIPVSALTSRELEVLRLIVKGKSNKEIGAELGIIEGTVKYHVSLILSKMGVQDRTEAATEAIRRGLVSLD